MSPEFALQYREQVEQFRRKFRTGLVTLVFTDLVGSTQFKHALGDRDGVALLHQHHAQLRELLSRSHDAQEISTAGDSFFIAFVKPSDAVRFALLLRTRNRALSEASGHPVQDRVGVHLGEVVVQEQEGTSRPRDFYGSQVDLAARVMALAGGDQILLTRSVFDSARQVLKGTEVEGVSELRWLNHGPYVLKGLEEPVEVCEVRVGSEGPVTPPTSSEKAQRYASPDAEPVLGWRPALDQLVPNTQWVLEKKLGEGGFGEVWLGRHQMLKERRVFKFCFRADRVRSLKREMTLFRVLKERVGDHPNIVRLLEVYFEEPPFYIVMDHVEGQDLKAWCEQQGGVGRIPLAARLEIVAQIADALQAAHDAGVIHRDVKPANILVSNPKSLPDRQAGEIREARGTVQDGADASSRSPSPQPSPAGRGGILSQSSAEMARAEFAEAPLPALPLPAGEGWGEGEASEVPSGPEGSTRSFQTLRPIQAKLTDFGIGQVVSEEALKGVTKAGFTQTIVAESSSSQTGSQMYMAPELLAGKPASTRSDTYSLGVVLYQLLVGDFTRPVTTDWANDTKDPLLQDDLQHCFAGNPQDRFAGAGQLAKNLRSLPDRQAAYEERRRTELAAKRRRNTTLVSAGVAGVLLLVAIALGYGLRRAESEATKARRNLYAADMKLAHQAWEEGNLQRAQELLRLHSTEEDLRGFEWRYLWKLCRDESKYSFTNFTHEVRSLAFSLDGGLLAVASGKTVTLLDVAGRRELDVLPEPGGWITALAFSPTATNVLATAIDSVEATDRSGVTRAFKSSQWPITPGGTSVIKLLNVATKEVIATFPGHTAEIDSIAFSRDGKRLASTSWDNTMRLWDIASQNLIRTLKEHPNPSLGVALTHDSNTLVCDSGLGRLELWDVATGKRIAEDESRHTAWVLALALSPGEDTVATVANDGQVNLWDFPAGRQRSVLTGHQGPIESVAFAATGKLLATAGADNTVRVWDVASERQVALLRGHAAPVTSVAFAPDGETLVSGGLDRTVKVWDATGRTNANLLKGPRAWTDAVAFSPDGTTLASVDFGKPAGLIKLWDLPSRRFLTNLVGHTAFVRCAAFSPNGRILASGSHDRTVKLWDLATRTETGSLSHEFAVCSVAFSPDGNTLAAAGDGVTFWDVASRQAVKGLMGDTRGVYFVAFSPTGGLVAVGSSDGRVGLWDFASRQLLASFKKHNSQVKSLAFSNDGTLLASGSHDATVVLYDVAARQYLETLRGHTFIVHGVAFSLDDKTLASASWDGTVKLWNLASRQLALTLRGHPGPVAGVAFARDGNLMATCGADSDVIVRLWPAASLVEINTSEPAKAHRD